MLIVEVLSAEGDAGPEKANTAEYKEENLIDLETTLIEERTGSHAAAGPGKIFQYSLFHEESKSAELLLQKAIALKEARSLECCQTHTSCLLQFSGCQENLVMAKFPNEHISLYSSPASVGFITQDESGPQSFVSREGRSPEDRPRFGHTL